MLKYPYCSIYAHFNLAPLHIDLLFYCSSNKIIRLSLHLRSYDSLLYTN